MVRPSTSEIEKSPRERVLLLARRIGEHAVADWCAELLAGTVAYDDPLRPPIEWLGGRHAAVRVSGRGFEAGNPDYWPRVWAARGLMYVWHAGAARARVGGPADPAWRVREMSARWFAGAGSRTRNRGCPPCSTIPLRVFAPRLRPRSLGSRHDSPDDV